MTNRKETVVDTAGTTLANRTTGYALDSTDIGTTAANTEPMPKRTSTANTEQNSKFYNETAVPIAHSTIVAPNAMHAHIEKTSSLRRSMRTSKGWFLS